MSSRWTRTADNPGGAFPTVRNRSNSAGADRFSAVAAAADAAPGARPATVAAGAVAREDIIQHVTLMAEAAGPADHPAARGRARAAGHAGTTVGPRWRGPPDRPGARRRPGPARPAAAGTASRAYSRRCHHRPYAVRRGRSALTTPRTCEPPFVRGCRSEPPGKNRVAFTTRQENNNLPILKPACADSCQIFRNHDKSYAS